ncbi:MAG: hypothetical protein AUH14_05270 [Candidatus Rokubacteria bacterium 13_2_20CM_69_15_1]|nr:MAG: hypothetical protein AUH14_05270 [Candidatus Rokubacteria bacterium 13_2_20CM_69_15_1]
MRRVISLLGVVALMLFALGTAGAQDLPCDFLTGGGYIILDNGAKGNFGVGGSCKQGGDGHGLWGHLEYHDHGTGLNVHWLTVTGYFFCIDTACVSPVPPTELGVPGTRLICGTARTNQFGDVDWAVRATDSGKSGGNDLFAIRLTKVGAPVYTTGPDQTLAGGNIQIHKPNNSTKGPVTNLATDCPAFEGSIGPD